MAAMKPHITFHGLCREALTFYREIWCGDINQLSTYDESPVEFPSHLSGRVMYAEFDCQEISFLASDGVKDSLPQGSGDLAIHVLFSNKKRQSDVFSGLSKEGHIYMPLDDTFWQMRYGIVTDKYGIRWMLSCPSHSL
ncbi:VOC family protein [Veronia pacifica]|uniref:PhnB protein n=1 Tax=Veronia pacifica TaxID=1080227 RepID=A0A1C3EPP4_9GAMM|nr:VOC family protein [Veronia pacifica]ODA35217.1 PhnB protein [Veronia pacifica]